MQRTAFAISALLCLLSSCGSDATKSPPSKSTPASSTPPAAETSKPPAEAAPKEAVKVQADTTKPPAEAPKAPAEAPKTSDAGSPPADSPKSDAPTPSASKDMDTAYKELMAKPEQPDESIEIQHCLIGFKGAPRLVNVTRSKDEAKTLAQKVFDEAVGGADFDGLVKQYTNDSAPGIYPLTKAGRARMVKSFGDVGFRLKVGEIGIAVWDATASPFGWHIIKRVK